MTRHKERIAESTRQNLAQVMTFAVAAAALVALLILGRTRGEKEGTLAAKPGSPVAAGANDPVLIEVDGVQIHASEYQAAVASFPAQMRQSLASAAGRQEIAEQLVKMKLLEQEARRLHLDDAPEVRGPLTVMHSQILAAAALEHLVKKSGAVNLREYYDQNREKFERVRFRQILIAVEGGEIPPKSGKLLSEDAARKKAESIVARIRAGATFEQLAGESDDPGAAERGGDMGSVRRGMLPSDLETPVFALKPNQVSDPIRSRYGFHVFQVTERTVQSFDELQPMFKQQESNLKAEKVVDGLLKNAEVKLDPKFFGTARLQ